MQSSAVVVESCRRIGQGCSDEVAGIESSAASTLALACFRLICRWLVAREQGCKRERADRRSCLVPAGAAAGPSGWVFHSDFCMGGNDTFTAEPALLTGVSLLLWPRCCVAPARTVCLVLCNVRIASSHGPKLPCFPSFSATINRTDLLLANHPRPATLPESETLLLPRIELMRRCNLPSRPFACGERACVGFE